ncbi:TRAP transporter large permease [Rhizobium sp. CSW-27]|uniref:TRAP transporter large permease n=1 Tax=Rhizobium sp. CSW-27 TaxID=2839985 RepID=UPI001C0213A1|nr:TRAP transporter large permease [Rhizobium sp. CSW-27]MBT9370376.1 TRAP transporter large permease [Rhizobium sp. CSW-27]
MTLALSLCLLAILVLAAIGTPVAFSILAGSIVYLAVKGQDLAIAGEQMVSGLYDSFVLLAVPLFIIAANIMNAGTVSERLLQFCVATVGRFRGGLGHVNIVSSVIFSGMSGSAVADAAGVGRIVIDMMRKSGHYSPGYAAALTAASATIGPIIPPSIPMVLYALVSNTSIGYLFLGGVTPGLLMAAVLMVMNSLYARRRGLGRESAVPVREIPALTFRAFPVLLMPAILLYGIYGGIATPTEAAAIAAAYALVLAALVYRSLTLRSFYDILVESVRPSASVGLVIGGALVLNYIVASENIGAQIAAALTGIQVSPLVFLFGVNILLLVLGCVLDASTIILVILPLFIPTCRELGIDLIHFGVVAVVNTMIGLITPPYGILLFVINATARIPLVDIIREIWGFIAALVFALVLMILFPELILWLPQLFGYAG